jgi:heterodisulfide reductase subunit B
LGIIGVVAATSVVTATATTATMASTTRVVVVCTEVGAVLVGLCNRCVVGLL